MTESLVVHVREAPFDVYIGRAFMEFPESIWHNPFKVRPGHGRDAVVYEYDMWLDQPEQAWLKARIPELKGKVLGCWCNKKKSPKRCHGHVLARRANYE
jgi:hypothetical protein